MAPRQKKRRTKKRDKPFALRYFIVCDEARQETSRKLLLIGVYADTIVVPFETQDLPRIAFVFCYMRLTDELPESGTFRLEGPNGIVLPETTFAIKQESAEFRSSNMLIQAAGVPLTPGKHRAIFTVNNSTEFVGEFFVFHDPTLLRPLASGQ
jgi:hypothetical protein